MVSGKYILMASFAGIIACFAGCRGESSDNRGVYEVDSSKTEDEQ